MLSVFYKFYKYRFPLLILSLWLAMVLLVKDYSANSQLIAAPKLANIQQSLVSQRTINTTVNAHVRKTVLENGLTVITKEAHTAPVVTVQVWYKVGSRNEELGVNGIAHQLEHMMFKGTVKRPVQFGRLFSALGSDSNAFTSFDQTAYYGTAERKKLKALLELEADRMQNSRIESEELASEKRVVISELQGYENSPEYRLNRAVMRSVFPDHQYGLPVGGTKADVEKFTVEEVQKYYRNFYSPDNAVLVIVGNFQTEPTLATVKEIFGKLSRSGNASQESKDINRKLTIAGNGGNKIVLQEPGAASLLQVVYPLPDIKHPDVPALDVMDYILSEGRNSRLYLALVDSGLATDISGSVASLVESGWYEISVTASPKQDLQKIEATISKAIASLAQKGVTSDEVNRAKAQFEASIVLENRDIINQAMQLANDELVTGDYDYINNYLKSIRKVTPQDVQRVANKYLLPEARTIGYFKPTQAPISSKSNIKAKPSQTHESFTSGAPINPAELSKYLPQIEDTSVGNAVRTLPQSITLANGMRVLMLPDKSTPTITLSGYVKAGAEFDCDRKAGLAAWVAENLLNGTKTKDALALAKALEERGATLHFDASREGVRIEGDSLAGDLPVLIHILADAVKNPTFPKKELELSRKHALIGLKEDLDDPDEVARRTFVQSVYPKKHPSHRLPTENTLRSISRTDALAFKEKYYRPDTTVLALVGDFDPAKALNLIKTELGDWQVSGKPDQAEYPAVSMPDSIVRVNSVLPGKAQAVTYMGGTAIKRNDPRYYAAQVLNQILGGDTLSSRLGAEVRDRLGLTYGIFSNFLAGRNSGTFLIEMQTSPEDTNKAIASTRKLLEDIHKQGVSEEEVEIAKRTAISNYIVSLANPDELTHQILMNEVYGYDTTELREFTDKINQVSLAQVNLAARELLHPDKIVVVTAGPAVVAGQ